jgi:biotin transport system substrate-specific component
MTIAMPRIARLPQSERGITIADFLVPIRLGERISSPARHLGLILLGTLLVVLATRVIIPADPVPFTGQTFAVLLVGGALGLRRGVLSMLLYLAIGIAGLPVFSDGRSGIGQLLGINEGAIVLGARGGYLVGFVAAAAVVGKLAELGWDRKILGAIAAMAIGNLVIYAIGVPWLMAATGMPAADAISAGMTKFLVWDGVKILLAAGLFPAAWWLVGRRPDGS